MMKKILKDFLKIQLMKKIVPWAVKKKPPKHRWLRLIIRFFTKKTGMKRF